MKIELYGTRRSTIGIMVVFFLFAFAYSVTASAAAQEHQSFVTIITGGKSHAVIIAGQDAPKVSLGATKELQHALREATSVTVPILKDRAAPIPSGDIRIIVGSGKAARAHGVKEKSLKPEAFRIKITPDYIVLVGHDIKATGNPASSIHWSRATQWAVDYLLDRYVGVRWLWPGPSGPMCSALHHQFSHSGYHQAASNEHAHPCGAH